jgi:L-rhamnose mutarotase
MTGRYAKSTTEGDVTDVPSGRRTGGLSPVRHAAEKENAVERVCFLARVRPDRLAEYRERHRNVWPEMRATLRDAGWGNYSLFLTDDGLLIGYLETEDYQAALDAMSKTPVNERWQAGMSEFFVNDGSPDESFLRVAEVFHLD